MDAQAIELHVEFIDHMGADKLIYAKSILSGERINVRVSADLPIEEQSFFIHLPRDKVHIFDKASGQRLEQC